VGLLWASVLAQSAHGQAYPSEPLRLVVTYPPGGSSDLMARVLAQGPHSWDATSERAEPPTEPTWH
jgi:tripartite-type tricarboxylate transporter receptor subunit TctC